jgi:glutathione S-transferase
MLANISKKGASPRVIISPMSLPVLYSFRRCPYAIRARVTLLYSGIPVELREVELGAKPPELIACSPKATVPVLLPDEAQVLEESLDIMHWALEQNDPDGWLDTDRSAADTLIATNDGAFKKHLDAYKYSNYHPEKTAEEHRADGEVFLRELELRLKQQPYLLGPKRSFADVAIAPFVRQFANVDFSWFEAAANESLRNWLRNFTESALFLAAMRKYPAWQAGNAVAVFR